MNTRVAYVCVVLVAFAVVQTLGTPNPADSKYTTKYDNIDVDKILSSKRLVVNYVQCLLDKKPCSPEGRELKKILPDAMKTQCEKCSTVQKNTSFKVIDRLQTKYEKEYQQLLDKWDPKREYSAKFEEFMKKEKKKGSPKF